MGIINPLFSCFQATMISALVLVNSIFCFSVLVTLKFSHLKIECYAHLGAKALCLYSESLDLTQC